MDAEVIWNVSEDVNCLLAAILNCKRELTKNCFTKFGSAKIVEYKVFAPHKVCELMLLLDGHTLIKVKQFDTYYHKAITQFEHFKLFKTKLYSDNVVRVEAKFEVDECVGKYWYGNIVLA